MLNNNIKTKQSYGISCCKFDKTDNKLKILLVKKRHTYNYISFVFGKYKVRDRKRLAYLFNGMTIQEKIDILSFNFDIIWYKIWLTFPETIIKNKIIFDMTDIKSISNTWNKIRHFRNRFKCDINKKNIKTSDIIFYNAQKNKYNSLISVDGSRYLKSLIKNTKNGKLIWEIPKGRKEKNETSIDCAIREFREETGIVMNFYNILYNINPVLEYYVSDNCGYKHNYFVAYTNKDILVNIDNKHKKNYEIESIKWASIDEIKYLDHSKHLFKIVNKIFKILNSKYYFSKNKNLN